MSKMDGVEALQTYVDKLEEAGVNQQQMSFYLEYGTGSHWINPDFARWR